MLFSEFISKVNHYQNSELGGWKSQIKLAPKIRKSYTEEMILSKHPKRAAVLALFYPDEQNETTFLLTKRASYKGLHAAQISFPGGKPTSKDKNLQYTALREAYEETALCSKKVKIIRQLSNTYIPPSNFLVAPFLAFCNYKPAFVPNYEVGSLIEVSVSNLLDNKNLTNHSPNTLHIKKTEVPCFKLNNYMVWGATAMILSEIKDLLK
ncbi:MAG: NUDIX hydrolase [Tenacibaculum sp.]